MCTYRMRVSPWCPRRLQQGPKDREGRDQRRAAFQKRGVRVHGEANRDGVVRDTTHIKLYVAIFNCMYICVVDDKLLHDRVVPTAHAIQALYVGVLTIVRVFLFCEEFECFYATYDLPTYCTYEERCDVFSVSFAFAGTIDIPLPLDIVAPPSLSPEGSRPVNFLPAVDTRYTHPYFRLILCHFR